MKVPVHHTVARYHDAGYSFIVITDHDIVTDFSNFNSPDFLVIPGKELTLPNPFWPLGRHMVVINNEASLHPTEADSKIIIPAHPNWPGNFSTGIWRLSDLIKIPDLLFLEIFNRHSDPGKDLHLWHQILRNNGYQKPIWGVAVDDSNNGIPLDKGWIMLKTTDISKKSFFKNLRNGNFYATTGPKADFIVDNRIIRVVSEQTAEISFIDQFNKKVLDVKNTVGEYSPRGDEGFIRVEITDKNNHSAWSQPFFLIREEERR